MLLKNIAQRFAQLPAAQIADEVNLRLQQHDTLVITAPPGAGKSTLLPLTILQGLNNGGKILMLEPRRLAARQIAERMAAMLGEQVGQTVGYRIRFENRVSAHTRIEVLTEGILTRMLVADPMLEGVSVVIFDEFHERSLASDVALALTREAQQIIRPDLRVVLMSATIDASAICQTLHADLIESQGKMYPVEIIHSTTEPSMQNVQEIAEAVAHQVRIAHQQHKGDILAFLPGEAEIRRCQEMLQGALGETHIFPLYGMLTSHEQQQAIAPSQPDTRKVVLATPIAETSLTIQGVRVVIDSGLCRTMVFEPQNGLSHLKTIRISKDMAEQRSGRAGRVAPGTCYRLWSLATEHRMTPCRTPEIIDADLAPMLLDVAAWGEERVEQIAWLTPPPVAHVAQGRKLLQLLHAIDAEGTITNHGRQLAKLPCHPRIAQMMLKAETQAQKALAADIAALLEEKDPLANQTDAGTDICYRIEALRNQRRSQRLTRGWERIARIAEQYRAMAHSQQDDTSVSPYEVGLLLAAAYPERIAKCVNEGACLYRMASGEQAVVERSDQLSAHEWIVVANVNIKDGRDGKIFLASPVLPQDLIAEMQTRERVEWDSRQGVVTSRQEDRIGCLLVDSHPIHNPPREAIAQAICEAAQKEGTSMLDFNEDVQNLQRRVATVNRWHPEFELPDLSTESVLKQASEWLPLYLGKSTTISELKKINLCTALWGLLSYEQQQQVEQRAPTHIQVPTGSRIRVEYRQGAELPIVRVRLQECFGLTDTPRVDNGQYPILMELLSPGFKPVQLTQDLHSFWQNTYFDVRKELRRRYPKHSWPDNPLEAEAVRGVKKTSK